VRGENPYIFPYRIWPNEFSPEHTFSSGQFSFPKKQLNGKPIAQNIELLSLFLTNIGPYQHKGYTYILNKLKQNFGSINGIEKVSFENMETFGYTFLQKPLEALNIIYPHEYLTDAITVAGQEPEIDINELVGKSGLARIMTHELLTATSPVRYNFEYIDVEKYGRIFAPSEIHKYSSKIANICQRIINSTGVVLIYSQYIDGGVVPIALALEELGFTRAQTNVHSRSLFKTPPSPPLSLDKKNNAKYVMITGDKGFTPNSKNDIKLLTSDENFDGSKVKVVLITQAGSEGLDLKFIRQVHILDPWYNMNRIEQIIGRAVRNCSHKILPFKQRNTEIYLYGTILENKNEEAADLYVYRLAELKAIQIGYISRILKEISVDCILNAGQMNFTVENMQQTVKQELSSGVIIENYQVGDKPFSSTCDYMEKCAYVCNPDKKITEAEVKLDTYNEAFLMMNLDKIILRIKSLMKERFFYRKNDLIIRINAVKTYPLSQINAGLNQLIEDKYEYITDKYGRLGNLINIDDLYLFQPLELNDKNISVYERSVPIEYKHDTLSFILPKVAPRTNAPKEALAKETVARETEGARETVARETEGARETVARETVARETVARETVSREAPKTEVINLLKKMNKNYTTAKVKQVIERGEDNWYKFCSLVIDNMKKDVDIEILLGFLISHIVDELSLTDKISLLNYLLKLDEKDEFEKRIKQYLESMFIIKDASTKGIMLDENGKAQLFILTYPETNWKKAGQEDLHDFSDEIKLIVQKFLPPKEKLNKFIGFMGNIKNEYVIFKVKDLTNKRSKGARCDQSGKNDAIKILNAIIGQEKYAGNVDISQKQVCVMQEFLLKLYNYTKKDNKHWFLTPTESILINIETLKYL
jgi:hypothetical protein